MGRQGAEEMAEQDISLETAIVWQVTSNHYPPKPYMVAPCLDAINQVNNTGIWDAPVSLPSGVLWQGRNSAPASVIIEDFHLEPWIDDEGEL